MGRKRGSGRNGGARRAGDAPAGLAARIAGLSGDARPDAEVARRILELCAPYEDDAATGDDRRNLVMCGVVAWNLSLFEGDEFEAMFAEFAATVPDFDDAMRGFFLDLVGRKRELYPSDRRYVFRYELSGRGADLAFRASAAPLGGG